jgi:hypothetical protein
VIYASTAGQYPAGKQLLDLALDTLLSTIDEPSKPEVLWSMSYQQLRSSPSSDPLVSGLGNKVLVFPPLSSDLAFDDAVLDQVESTWRQVLGQEAEGVEFLVFEDREGELDEEEEF